MDNNCGFSINRQGLGLSTFFTHTLESVHYLGGYFLDRCANAAQEHLGAESGGIFVPPDVHVKAINLEPPAK